MTFLKSSLGLLLLGASLALWVHVPALAQQVKEQAPQTTTPAAQPASQAAPTPESQSKPQPAPRPASQPEAKQPSKQAQDAPAAPTKPEASSTVAPAEAPTAKTVDINDIRHFVSVFRALDQAYVDDVEHKKLMRSAIRGLLFDLDPHSAYLEKKDMESLNDMASGGYGGLGIEVMFVPEQGLLVIAPMDDTPASRADIQPGDVIVGVNGTLVTSENGQELINELRGEPGSKIRLTIARESEPEPFDEELIRERIDTKSARAYVLADDFVYMRIASFQSDTARELRRALSRLQKARKSDFKGAVLDLRRNPGGLLDAAVEVSDLFLEGGQVVSTRGRLPSSNEAFSAMPGDMLHAAPIVVLMDAGTASAAEIVAGALRDHKRALTMGERSFGKGSVQSVFPLDNGDAVKITTARYYTPNGTSIQAAGIEPDVPLKERGQWVAQDSAPSIREADLPSHLNSTNIQVGTIVPLNADDSDNSSKASKSTAAQEPKISDEDARFLREDHAIQEALNLLRGLALYSSKRK